MNPNNIVKLLFLWKNTKFIGRLAIKKCRNIARYKKFISIERYICSIFPMCMYGVCWCRREVFIYFNETLITSSELYLEDNLIACRNYKLLFIRDILTKNNIKTILV